MLRRILTLLALGGLTALPARAQDSTVAWSVTVRRDADTLTLDAAVRALGGRVESRTGRAAAVRAATAFADSVTAHGYDWLVIRPQVLELAPERTDAALIAAVEPPWGIAATGADIACLLGGCGQGVTFAGLDTGLADHPDYAPLGRESFSGGTGYDDISSCNGHGTHTFGTMGGRFTSPSPDARGYELQSFANYNGSCLAFSDAFAQAIERATALRVDVLQISASFGAYGPPDIQLALQHYIAGGGIACIAAGNGGGAVEYPGAFPEATSAAAWDGSGIAGFSGHGPQVFSAAPGVYVVSTMPGGYYGGKSGTSMAAPFQCALLMQIISYARSHGIVLTRAQVLDLAARTAQRIGAGDRNDYAGYGVIRPDRAILSLRGGAGVLGDSTRNYTNITGLITDSARVACLATCAATSSSPWLTVTVRGQYLVWTLDPFTAASDRGTISLRSQ